MIITFKYKLQRTSYARRLKRHAISLNQVWNYAVSLQKKIYDSWKYSAPKQSWFSEYSLNKLTAGTSKELDTHAGSIHEINRLFTISRNKIKRSPKFRKSFGPKHSLGWVPFRASDRKISGNSIRFCNKTYRWLNDRPLPQIVKGGAFVEDSLGRWWITFHVEVPTTQTTQTERVGIDLGLKTLATLSDGTKIENPKILSKWEQKLAVSQRAHNKRRTKAIHQKIKNIRADYIHKATTNLIQNYKSMFIGDLKVQQLAKTKMAKSILDAGCGMFRNQLRHKASRHGVDFHIVNENYSTQTCSNCRVIPDSSPKGMDALGIREWVCSNCKVLHDRDVNAAKNILTFGLSAQPLAEETSETLKELA